MYIFYVCNLHSLHSSLFPKVQSRNISIIYQCIPLSVGWSISRTPGLESNALHVWDLNQICLVSVGWALWVPLVGTVQWCHETFIQSRKVYKTLQNVKKGPIKTYTEDHWSQYPQKTLPIQHTGILPPSLYALQYAVHVIQPSLAWKHQPLQPLPIQSLKCF